jgi:DNA-binding LacI/PurR family transcriptional regulator
LGILIVYLRIVGLNIGNYQWKSTSCIKKKRPLINSYLLSEFFLSKIHQTLKRLRRRKESSEVADQVTKVLIAAPTFHSVIHITMHEQLKKFIKPEEMTIRSVTDDADVQKERLERALMQAKPTALIAMSVRPDPEMIATFTAAEVPIILVDEEAPGASSVSPDDCMGGRIAGEYLIKKGRKRIAIVTGRTQVKGGYNAEQRLKGFHQALSAKGLSIPVGCAIEVIHYSREDGVEVMPQLVEAGVDAVFCAAGDNCALGLLSVAKEMGKNVPDDIAIVGFDDLLIAQLSTPPLTTMKQPLDKMAEAAYKMAVLHRSETLRKPQKAVFNPELVIRKSA